MQDRKYWYDTVYNTKRWKQTRLQHILSNEDNALCSCCLNGHLYCCAGMNETEASTIPGYGKRIIAPMFIVDHILALSNGGDPWSLDNLRSYCLSCHSRKTKRIDSADRRNKRIDATHEDLENFTSLEDNHKPVRDS